VTGRVGPRLLVAFGFMLGAYVLYQMMQWTPNVSEWSVIGAGFTQGVSVGFLTIPINLLTFATLPAAIRTEGTSVYSLMRNLGSALGISVTGALLETNTQVNHALIAADVNPFNRALETGGAARLWNPETARGLGLLNAEVTRQAQIIAYVDDFKLMFVLAIIVLPLVALTRRSAAK
jgi:MFS transporter, DHA2 family, multidrug resistance protein